MMASHVESGVTERRVDKWKMIANQFGMEWHLWSIFNHLAFVSNYTQIESNRDFFVYRCGWYFHKGWHAVCLFALTHRQSSEIAY